MQPETLLYPVRVRGDLDPALSRWQWRSSGSSPSRTTSSFCSYWAFDKPDPTRGFSSQQADTPVTNLVARYHLAVPAPRRWPGGR